MIRQRINLHRPALGYVVDLLILLLGAALIWYGLMVVLLAVKVSPHTVNSISAYRTLYDDAAGLRASDFDTVARLVAGVGGLIAFLVFLYLAFQQLPRPHLARSEVAVGGHERGCTSVKPRAIERLAELSARGNPAVASAAGRLDDQDLVLSIVARRAASVAQTIADVRSRVAADLDRHELPPLAVSVTLTGYEPKTRRELS
jgi:hypothetical protein